MKKIVCSVWLILMLLGCTNNKSRQGSLYAEGDGFYYRLISFGDEKSERTDGSAVVWLNAEIATLSDSVFWDSRNNLNDRLFLYSSDLVDRTLEHLLLKSDQGDSLECLVEPLTFFKWFFNIGEIPYFCRQDSALRFRFKVERWLSEEEADLIEKDFEINEQEQIIGFFGDHATALAHFDQAGFYYIGQKAKTITNTESGEKVAISYKSYFLNGRPLEPFNPYFEFVSGTPDQLIKGVNLVAGRLEEGENVKIILPSRLAFGEKGSSNRIVPPFTPLVYEITRIGLQKKR